ncbi:ankyrin [Bimuria novae-zelandiae CBS 107.79]|uniref:Ankyrin n=1 Tax=Bimuria novae-zelandiae CBS 107.79 TaxID=1447943 RepID=A0A6A5UZS4_9PLEO|nr:ankyrin [Bimuria novae-zelandiae CBS 107.79]
MGSRISTQLVNLGLIDEGLLLLKRHYNDIDNANEPPGRTTLCYAVAHGLEEFFKDLIDDHGADVRWRDAAGATLCHIAVPNHRLGVLNLLVSKYNLDPDARDDDQRAPLQYLFDLDTKEWHGNKLTVAETILSKFGVSLGDRDARGRTPLMDVIDLNNRHHDKIEIYSPLLPWAGVNTGDDFEKIAMLLLDKYCVSPTSQDNEGNTPLSIAMSSRSYSSHRLMQKLFSYPDVVVDDDIIKRAAKYQAGEALRRSQIVALLEAEKTALVDLHF